MKLTVYKNKKVYNPEYRGIYSITFDNGKRYIGMSERVQERLWEHYKAMEDENDTLPVHKAMRKHSFEFELLEECPGNDRKELAEREKYWISYYDTYKDKNKGYNLTPGGDGSSIGCYNSSAKLNEEQIQEIYDKLIYNKNLYIYQIAAQYDISPEAISDINNGRRYYNSNLSYPLRENPDIPVGRGIDNHLAIFKSQKEINNIYEDLKQSQLSLREIAGKYNCSYTTISKINRGLSYATEGIEYPIRKQKQKKRKISNEIVEQIRKLLINTEKTFESISNEFNISVDSVRRINNGYYKIYIDNRYTYPLRANKKINKAVSTILESEEQDCY